MTYHYQNFFFHSGEDLSDFITAYGLEAYEIVSVHQQDRDNSGNYMYMIIFRIEKK